MNHLRHKFLNIKGVSACLLMPFVLGVSNSYAENLLQVYEHAKVNDAQLKISEAGFLAALEAKPQVRSALKPQVNLSANSTLNVQHTGRTIQSDDNTAFFNVGYTLSLSKSLINKKIDAQVEQVDASILQAKANIESDRQALIIRVADAYFQYLNAVETLAFRQAEKKAIGKQLNQVQAFFDAGRSAITDVKEAKARFDLADAQIAVANQQIDLAKESLRAITTRSYNALEGASNNIALLIPEPKNIDLWSNVAISNSKQLLSAKYGVDIAQGNVDIERSGRNATVNIVAQHRGSSTFGEDMFDRDVLDASIGLQLNIPILDGGNISSRIRQSRLRLQQARQQLELQKRQTVQQTRAAYLAIVSNLAQVNALKQALNSTQAASNATQAGFEAGTRTAVDVLLALRETFSAKRDYTTARYAFLLNTLKLKQAVGNLSESDLAAVSKLLAKKS